jgi:fermentation-respiration switch protein FrsA (DUF1100 family)
VNRLTSLAVLLIPASLAAGRVPLSDETFAYATERPAAGLWVGNLEIGDSWRFGVFRIEHDDGAWSVRGTVAVLLAMDAEAGDVAIDDDRVTFVLEGQMGSVRFDGTITEGGQRVTGTLAMPPDGENVSTGEFELARTVPVMSRPDAMAFSGAVDVQGMMKLDMSIALATTPAGNWIGHLDVPAQMAHGLPLAEVARDDTGSITATLPGPVPAHFELRLEDDGRRLAGSMSQGAIVMEVDFPRDAGYVGSTMRRPQHPSPPYPYEAREVEIEHPDGHTLAGTLTIPPGPGPFPAAILITGSGPQDRDETVMGHKPFLVLADHLTRRGIAILRYDDRGFARSTGTFDGATSADFATDAAAAFAFMVAQESIDANAVGLIGHSEGAIVAPLVTQSEGRVAFVVLMAGPGVPGDEILRIQAEKIMRAEGAGDDRIAWQLEQQQEIFSQMKAIEDDEALRAAIRPIVEKAVREQGGDDPGDVDEIVDAQLAQLLSPWMRFFMAHDPRPSLRAMRCPVLALNGTLDLQVWHEQNLDEIDRVIRSAGGDVTIRRYENLNHLFQPAETGAVSEYARIETTMDERVLEEIAAWIVEETEGGRRGRGADEDAGEGTDVVSLPVPSPRGERASDRTIHASRREHTR